MTVTMKNGAFWDVTPCGSFKNRHFGDNHEECLLLRYKYPIGTSQETHYISATELSQLMLSNI
jgi:hypothetical protein